MRENQRVRISKRLLHESLLRLLAAKSIHKISVREICEGAEINRTTFYKYYGSQYDLLKDMESEVLDRIDRYLGVTGGQTEDEVRWLTEIATYLGENLDLCRLLVNNSVDTGFFEKLVSLPMINRLLSAQLGEDEDPAVSDYVYQFVVNGGYSIIKRWLNREDREPPEKIARLLLDTVSRQFA